MASVVTYDEKGCGGGDNGGEDGYGGDGDGGCNAYKNKSHALTLGTHLA